MHDTLSYIVLSINGTIGMQIKEATVCPECNLKVLCIKKEPEAKFQHSASMVC